jgi:hypothetical protein
MHKPLIIAVAFVVVLVGGFFAINSYIYNEKQADTPAHGDPALQLVGDQSEPRRATFTGVSLCLPHVDTSGPQTEECASGMRTDSGEYYAVDMSLMSQAHPEIGPEVRFTANGVITPVARLSSDHWRKYPIVGIFSVTDSVSVEGEHYACNGDARICPDGSSVGRTGPRCDFAACPSPEATTGRVMTYLGGTGTSLTVSATPKEIVSDSRCAKGVTCVWAGTVEVRTVLATPVSHGEHVLSLGKPQTFGDYIVTLVDVTPAKTEESIPESSYRFVFEVKKGAE